MKNAKYTHEELRSIALSNSEVKKEYDDLNDEFQLFREALKARFASGKTQDDVAKELHTTKSVISRLEHGGGRSSHSPSVSTLRKYAKAVGCRLEIKFLPVK